MIAELTCCRWDKAGVQYPPPYQETNRSIASSWLLDGQTEIVAFPGVASTQVSTDNRPSLSPHRVVLRRIGRAISLRVILAVQAVRERHSCHMPIWKIHVGMRQFLQLLRTRRSTEQMAEFDVEDCFLNRPIALVLAALNYWFTFDFRSRHGPSVLPSVKTGRQKSMLADHAHSLHYREITAEMVACGSGMGGCPEFPFRSGWRRRYARPPAAQRPANWGPSVRLS